MIVTKLRGIGMILIKLCAYKKFQYVKTESALPNINMTHNKYSAEKRDPNAYTALLAFEVDQSAISIFRVIARHCYLSKLNYLSDNIFWVPDTVDNSFDEPPTCPTSAPG